MTDKRWLAGTVSLILLGISIGVFFFAEITTDPNIDSMTNGLRVAVVVLAACLPLLVVAFIVGIVAIIKNHGRKQGITSVSVISCMVIALFVNQF